jgi:hypothetical protein
MTLAIFGITNDGVNLALNLLILFLVVIYLALVAWVYLDARRRLEDPVLVACSTVAALFPFVGPIVYSILRPPELLADAREREIEVRASELRVRQLEEASCPNCEHPIERTYLRCPQCRARIKDPCESCGKPVDPRWTLCPYCETPTRRGREAAVRARESSSSAAPPRRGASGAGSGSRKAAATSSSQSRSAARPQRSPASVRSSETRPLKPLPSDAPAKAPTRSGSGSSSSSAKSESSGSRSSAKPSSGAGGSGSPASPAPTRRSSASRERPERS